MNIKASNAEITYAWNVDITFDQLLTALQWAATKNATIPRLRYKGLDHAYPTKIYRVTDDGICILTTTDELKALRRYKEIMDANEKVNTWAWVDTEELQ